MKNDDIQTGKIFLKQQAEELPLSADPFAEQPLKADKKIIVDDLEEEVTVKDTQALRAKRNKDDEDTVVHKYFFKRKKDKAALPALAKQPEEVSSISIDLKVIPIAIGHFFKRSGRFFWRQKKIVFSLLGIVVLICGAWFGWRYYQLQKHGTAPPVAQKPKIIPKRPQGAPLQLSPLSFYSADNKAVSPKALKKGNKITVRFFINSWPVAESDNLQLAADIKIYSQLGELLLFQPKYVVFSKKVDNAQQKIQVDSEIELSQDMPVEFYRLMIDVTDLTTQRMSSLQTRVRVIE